MIRNSTPRLAPKLWKKHAPKALPTRALRVFRIQESRHCSTAWYRTHTGGCCSSLPPCHASVSLLLRPKKAKDKPVRIPQVLAELCCRSVNNPHQDPANDKSLFPRTAWWQHNNNNKGPNPADSAGPACRKALRLLHLERVLNDNFDQSGSEKERERETTKK